MCRLLQWNLCSQPPPNKGQLLYNGQAPRSQMNSLCTKQPLNKGHLCIKAKTLFPKGVRYRRVRAGHRSTVLYRAVTK